MWESIFLLAIASMTSGIALRLVEPMLPQLADDFGASISATSAVISAFAVAYVVGQLIYGPLGDRFGKLRVVTLSMAAAAAASIGCALAPDLASLTALRFLTALFSSSPVMLGMAYVGDQIPVAERQSAIARFVTGTIIGQTLGPLIGGLLTDLFGWRGTFVVLGLAFIAVASVLYLRTRPQWGRSGRASPATKLAIAPFGLLRLPRVRYVLIAVFFDTFFFFGAYSFLGPFLKLEFDLSPSAVGAILAEVGLGSILYTLVVKRLLAAMGQRGLVTWGGAICCACYALTLLSPEWVVAIPCTIVMGFSFYMLQNTLQLKATEMSPEARGAGMSIYGAAWSLGQACGVAIAGTAIGIVGYAPTIIGYGIGFLALGLLLRNNLHRLS